MYSAGLKRRLFAALPTPVRVQGRAYLRNCLLDMREFLTGRADPEVPPHRLNISGEGPYRHYGEATVEACRGLAGLAESDAFIDLGCGIGRAAFALTRFLRPSTPYLGFDVIRFAINWCRNHISLPYPNFRFVHSNIHNWVYNPGGTIGPEHYRFPAEDGAFRFALANSLFTHLGPAAAERYIAETSRVLAPGGRMLSSWFVLDPHTEAGGVSGSRFAYRSGECAYASLHAPEQAVAFERAWLERTLAQHGFAIEGLHFGKWSGIAEPNESFQDLVVARKL